MASRVRLLLALVGTLGAACVTKSNPYWQPASEGTGGASASGGSTTGGATTSSTSADPSTTSAGGSGTTDAESSTTGSGGSSGTGDGEPVVCDTPVLVERFAMLPSEDDWFIDEQSPVYAAVVNEQLRVFADLGSSEVNPVYWEMESRGMIPAAGAVGIEVVSAPMPAGSTQIYLGVGTGDWQLYFEVFGGDLEATRRDLINEDYTELAAPIPFDSDAHRWLRIRFDATTDAVVFETSPEHATWSTFAEANAEALVLADAVVIVGIGIWAGPVSGEFAAVDNLFVCDEP